MRPRDRSNSQGHRAGEERFGAPKAASPSCAVPHTRIAYPWYLDQVLTAGCDRVRRPLGSPCVTPTRVVGMIEVAPAETPARPPSGLPVTFPVPPLPAGTAALLTAWGALAHAIRRHRRGLRLTS